MYLHMMNVDYIWFSRIIIIMRTKQEQNKIWKIFKIYSVLMKINYKDNCKGNVETKREGLCDRIGGYSREYFEED